MIAFHGKPEVKKFYLARVRAHARADELVQGIGYEKDPKTGKVRACGVGCTLEAYDHACYPIELGVPMELARLEDRIFEGLEKSEAMKWPAAFLSAIPVGADLSMVWPRFAVWMLRDELAKHDKAGVCERLAKLYDRWSSAKRICALVASPNRRPTTRGFAPAPAVTAPASPAWSATSPRRSAVVAVTVTLPSACIATGRGPRWTTDGDPTPR